MGIWDNRVWNVAKKRSKRLDKLVAYHEAGYIVMA
jgi:hypothetical protein